MLTLKPIGYLKTGKQVKFQTLHQPSEDTAEHNALEIAGPEFEGALRDLEGFTRVWLIWWFHRNDTWRPMVLPPRGPQKRRGVFATRSPHRPNPIGMTPIQLLGIKGRTLLLGPCDLLDGTPVFDIKPYIPEYDAFPLERSGWLGEVNALMAQPPAFTVRFSALATTQAEWLLSEWNVEFRPRLIELLERDPTPHRTRRIKKIAGDRFTAGCGAWLAFFTIEGTALEIQTIEAGYPLRFLTSEGYQVIADRDAQLAFIERWPSERPG